MKTVKEVSELTGISIRTLRYYDEIDLLKPAKVTEAGYRLYDESSLKKLRQIMFFRELEVPLSEIKAIMKNSESDNRKILETQKMMLEMKRNRLNGIIELISDVLKGEDKMSFETFNKDDIQKIIQHYFPGAWVYHKRRTNFVQFFRQVWHSGYARIILYQKYPESLKWVHCLPALFVVGLLGVCISAFFVPKVWGLLLFYISLIFFDALVRNKNGIVALLSIIAAFVQLIGYGTGFLEAIWREGILRKKY